LARWKRGCSDSISTSFQLVAIIKLITALDSIVIHTRLEIILIVDWKRRSEWAHYLCPRDKAQIVHTHKSNKAYSLIISAMVRLEGLTKRRSLHWFLEMKLLVALCQSLSD